MMRRGILAALFLLGAAVLASAHLPDDSAAGAAASASATRTVGIVDFAFRPRTLKVDRGDRVAFTNSGSVAHTATRGGSFDTRRIAPGKTKVVPFGHRGTFAYHCRIHPTMRAEIVVE